MTCLSIGLNSLASNDGPLTRVVGFTAYHGVALALDYGWSNIQGGGVGSLWLQVARETTHNTEDSLGGTEEKDGGSEKKKEKGG